MSSLRLYRSFMKAARTFAVRLFSSFKIHIAAVCSCVRLPQIALVNLRFTSHVPLTAVS